MITKSDWTPEEVKIFEVFEFRCVHCQKNFAVTLHELIPKSLAPNSWNDPNNRIPLCAACHFWAHSKGTAYSRTILKQQVQEYLNG